jgi:MFS transporter, DHA3 family, tetracycline resistance protein
VLYRLDTAHLDPLQIVLVGTVLEVSYLIFNVPTGLLADVVSRRWSVTVGYFVLGVAYLFEGSAPLFVAIACAQVVQALGFALVDGAKQAWIADESGGERITHIYLRGSQFSQAGYLMGVLASGFVASFQLRFPFYVGGGLVILVGIFLMIYMPERKFRPETAEPITIRSAWRALPREAGRTAGTSWALMRRHHVLIIVFMAMAFYGLSSEGWDRLAAVHLIKNFTFPDFVSLKTPTWLSVATFIGMVLGLLATELVRRRVTTSTKPVAAFMALLGLTSGMIASIAIYAITTNIYLAMVAFWITTALRASYVSILNAWLARQVEPRMRATVLSVSQTLDSVGQIAGGPGVGAVATIKSVPAAMQVVAGALVPVLGLLALPLLRRRR